jgi:hypothetical protein
VCPARAQIMGKLRGHNGGRVLLRLEGNEVAVDFSR